MHKVLHVLLYESGEINIAGLLCCDVNAFRAETQKGPAPQKRDRAEFNRAASNRAAQEPLDYPPGLPADG